MCHMCTRAPRASLGCLFLVRACGDAFGCTPKQRGALCESRPMSEPGSALYS